MSARYPVADNHMISFDGHWAFLFWLKAELDPIVANFSSGHSVSKHHRDPVDNTRA